MQGAADHRTCQSYHSDHLESADPVFTYRPEAFHYYYLCVCVRVSVVCVEGSRAPGAGVTCGYKLPDVGTGNLSPVTSSHSSLHDNYWFHVPWGQPSADSKPSPSYLTMVPVILE